jgi:hypothetical protein
MLIVLRILDLVFVRGLVLAVIDLPVCPAFPL